MKKRLKDKVIIVAGAGTALEGVGNGKACAVQFAREGARVVCEDINESAAQATVKTIQKEGGEAVSCQADMLNASDIKRVIETCLNKYGKIDVLHNNIGVPGGGEIIDIDGETWDRVFNINVKTMFLSSKMVLPYMIENQGGCIINVSSIASHRPLPDAAYVASKGAVDSLTRYIAARYGRYNIRANVLLLGYIDTPLARPAWEIEKIKQINLRQVPLRRFASPWEVATVAAFLASDEASYINGVILPVDGGLCTSL
jgi:NAD(P)-dependent dehydrogenase (short-subunit alcohol dehydrogenase family)